MRKLAILATSYSLAVFISVYIIPYEQQLYFAAALGVISLFSIVLKEDKRKLMLLITVPLACGFIWTFSLCGYPSW